MDEIRCGGCGRLLAKAQFEQLEIKCPRCKTLNIWKAAEPLNQAPSSVNVKGDHNGQANNPVDGR